MSGVDPCMWFAVQVLAAPPSWLMNESGAKLLVMLAAVISLFMVGRWISARAESSAHDPTLIQDETPAVRPTILTGTDVPPRTRMLPFTLKWTLVPVVLRKLYFNGFDAASGPADPLSFVDDVTLEVYFKQTGSLFENTYTVATPAGLSPTAARQRMGHPVQPGNIYREPIRPEVDSRDHPGAHRG